MDKPHVYFSLMLTALRNEGYVIPTSDAATAALLSDALDIISPDSDDAHDTADSLTVAFDIISMDAISDNGSDGGPPIMEDEPTIAQLTDRVHELPAVAEPLRLTGTLRDVYEGRKPDPGFIHADLTPEAQTAFEQANLRG